jgi:hypothetical protein
VADDHRLFIGRRSDPFFFDFLGVLNNFRITGDDFFADKDVYSIVLPPDVWSCPRRTGPPRRWRSLYWPSPAL